MKQRKGITMAKQKYLRLHGIIMANKQVYWSLYYFGRTSTVKESVRVYLL